MEEGPREGALCWSPQVELGYREMVTVMRCPPSAGSVCESMLAPDGIVKSAKGFTGNLSQSFFQHPAITWMDRHAPPVYTDRRC